MLHKSDPRSPPSMQKTPGPEPKEDLTWTPEDLGPYFPGVNIGIMEKNMEITI